MITRRSKKFYTRFDTRWFEIRESGKYVYDIECAMGMNPQRHGLRWDIVMVIEDSFSKIKQEVFTGQAYFQDEEDDNTSHHLIMKRFKELEWKYKLRSEGSDDVDADAPELIIGVAIRNDKGDYDWRSWSLPEYCHHQCLDPLPGFCQLGFRTNHRKFVSRRYAAVVARRSGQLRRDLKDRDNELMEIHGLDSYYIWK